MPEEPRIVSYDSLEDMLAAIDEGQAAATAAATPTQFEIGWGEHVISYDEHIGIFILGKIEDQESFISYETEEAPTEEEKDQIVKDIQRHHNELHLRFGRWYSTICPEGEYGSKHVVTLWPITEDDFKRCQQNDWSPDRDLVLRLRMEAEIEIQVLKAARPTEEK